MLLGTGCGPDLEAICDDFVDQCGDLNSVEQCVERGEALEDMSYELECDAEWRDYLQCLDQASFLCDVGEDECGAARVRLESCGVDFYVVE